MTKPTQFGPPYPIGVGSVGGDPAMPDGQPVTDCCDDEPPDRASLLRVFVGADASDLTLVQSNVGTGNNVSGNLTVSFSAWPRS